MRLWHETLIPYLDRQRLLGQHRECCALRGAGWGRKHSTVNYVFEHVPEKLIAYHWRVLDEMEKRGYSPDKLWDNPNYRGKKLGIQEEWAEEDYVDRWYCRDCLVYSEHDDAYLRECIENLRMKGVEVNFF